MLFSWFYCSVVLLIDISFSIKYSDTLNADVLSDRPLAVEKKVNDHFSQFKAGEWNNVSRHFVEEVRPGIKNDSKDLKEPPRIHNKYFTSRWYLYKRKRALGPEQGQGHNMAATNELEPMAPKLLNTVRHPNEAEQKTQWKENPPSGKTALSNFYSRFSDFKSLRTNCNYACLFVLRLNNSAFLSQSVFVSLIRFSV
jgi:hypothetical protein